MKHRINGVAINLRTLTSSELDNLINLATGRMEAADEDLEKLYAEQVRRSTNVIPLFKEDRRTARPTGRSRAW